MTEHDIERRAIDLLCAVGYMHLPGAYLAPDHESEQRSSYRVVVLESRLLDAFYRLNPKAPAHAIEEAVKRVMSVDAPDLVEANALYYRLAVEGVKVTYRQRGELRGDMLRFIDFDTVDNNEFCVVDQLTITHKEHRKRPDLVLYVNGLPLVVIELKNPTRSEATIQQAYLQLQTYKATIPALFRYNALLVISDGLEARAGSLSAGMSRFAQWRSRDGKALASRMEDQLDVMVSGLLRPEVLLDMMRYFTVFERVGIEDEAGVVSIQTIKKVAAYHQYYAVNKALRSTIKAAMEQGDRRGGVIWHTQGSGKSLSMVFYTGKIMQALDNPTVVVITDRNDLDDQLYGTFAMAEQLLREAPVQAESRQHLKELLKVNSGGIVFTTIQKFQPDEGKSKHEMLTDRRNVVVVADEAHRSQYGLRGRTSDVLDDEGHLVGQRAMYGFAHYMREALPYATYLGFTGTPIEEEDKNTAAVFGDYVDIYDIQRAVEDGATVPIFYESRLAKIALTEEGRELVQELDEELEGLDLSMTQQAKAKWTKLEALIGSTSRIKTVAADIVAHFEARQEQSMQGKGMIVAMSRRIAVALYGAIVALRPDWHSDDLNKGKIKVVMTAASSDGVEMSKHHTSSEQRRLLANRMKKPDDELELVIVRDMWLTGFDAPSMHTLYIDKPMRGHNLMQAIARVNRVYKDKAGGLVVDYLGIAADLKKALAFYTKSGGKGEPAFDKERAIEVMLTKLEVVEAMFGEQPVDSYDPAFVDMLEDAAIPYLTVDRGVLYEQYYDADTATKLKIILAAEEHILSIENGKKRFIDEVTALSKAFSLTVPSEESQANLQKVGFFQAVKARLHKYDAREGGKSDVEIETAIRQVIDKAVASNGVVDIFESIGLNKPDMTILSEEFLEEVRDLKHKNVAMETLKKLLNDEIKARSAFNVVQARTLMELLESSIRRYQNKVLTAAEVVEELIAIARKVRQQDEEDKSTGMSREELAFYYAVASNESAKELMGNQVLRKLAVYLTEVIRKSATLDWHIKNSARANLRRNVKRALSHFGYPPDLEKLAVATVVEQAERMADWTVER